MTVIIKILGTNQNEFPSSKQYTTERDLTIVVVILSVFSFILVSGIIVYVIWRIKGPYLSNWRSFRNVTPIREHYTPQKATSQQHASLDMSQRTDDTYCSSYDARPFQYFNHAMNVSTDDISHNLMVKCRSGTEAQIRYFLILALRMGLIFIPYRKTNFNTCIIFEQCWRAV